MSTATYETIVTSVEQGVLTITMNRPDQLNACTTQMLQELTNAFRSAQKNDEVRAVVLTGAGRAFSAGQDLQDVKDGVDYGEHLQTTYNPLVKAVTSLEKPVVAAVNGVAAGAGASLAFACDFRIAHESASFLQAFVHIGLVPDSGATYFLPRLVGTAKALELAVLGNKVKADEAAQLGLVTEVVSKEDFEKRVLEFATHLAQLPTKAVGWMKKAMHGSFDRTLEESLDQEAFGQTIAGRTMDHQEGVQAFLEKRTPNFTGK
ncbi:enoyl-CoA hydratase-related protein [Bacillus fonticola]|uniref:enoyl-CoA hydratase-related protein n=1 Tax=Bacillus fonticola TaxID=2728853 RepID=UPI0014750623|nr:enoyl-CoA hydratase-related protein [Bacillus fonticola]